MSMSSGVAVRVAEAEDHPRAIGSPDFITRLAEELKTRSGSDLPLSCFIEQVKMQLAGNSPADLARAASERAKRTTAADYESSDCFKAWAMPE
jgi:hypothetical protein